MIMGISMSLRVSKPEFNEKLNELDRPVGTQGNNIYKVTLLQKVLVRYRQEEKIY